MSKPINWCKPIRVASSFLLELKRCSGFGCSNRGITDDDRQTFLNYHNEARRRVAKGIEPNKSGFLNPAKNMYKLVILNSLFYKFY